MGTNSNQMKRNHKRYESIRDSIEKKKFDLPFVKEKRGKKNVYIYFHSISLSELSCQRQNT